MPVSEKTVYGWAFSICLRELSFVQSYIHIFRLGILYSQVVRHLNLH